MLVFRALYFWAPLPKTTLRVKRLELNLWWQTHGIFDLVFANRN